MTGREYQEGDILYKEGDRSDNIYLVVMGSVEILKTISNKTEVVGTANPGDFIGEIASLIDRARSTTARIKEDGTRIKPLEKENFLRLISNEPATAYSLLTRLCERLHASSRRASDNSVLQAMRTAKDHNESNEFSASQVEEKQDIQVTIYPESASLVEQMPKEGLSITDSPFIIGRKLDTEEMESEAKNQWLTHRKDRRRQGERREDSNLPKVHLQFTDSQPYRLSRIHYLIQKMPDDRFIIRDLGSTLGTQVNEDYLGTDFAKDFIELDEGEHYISAGGSDSPFKLRLVIEST